MLYHYKCYLLSFSIWRTLLSLLFTAFIYLIIPPNQKLGCGIFDCFIMSTFTLLFINNDIETTMWLYFLLIFIK